MLRAVINILCATEEAALGRGKTYSPQRKLPVHATVPAAVFVPTSNKIEVYISAASAGGGLRGPARLCRHDCRLLRFQQQPAVPGRGGCRAIAAVSVPIGSAVPPAVDLPPL